jgi:hypothetical protein
LHALQAGFDDAPLGTINHHRYARNVGLRRDHVEKRRHCLFRIKQTLVHVDVDDLRARLDLLARHIKRRRIVVLLDEFAKLRRARDVGALADVDEGGRSGGARR